MRGPKIKGGYMKILIVELVKNDEFVKSESLVLQTERTDEFLEALVLLCNKLGVEVPIWTYKEEKMLLKRNAVIISEDNSSIYLKITEVPL